MVVPFVYTEEEYKKLEERIRFLEQCLDNKEKVNKSMRKKIRNLIFNLYYICRDKLKKIKYKKKDTLVESF